MRLSKSEIKYIKDTISKYLPSKIYLFGSQIDETKRGGDLDLYLIPFQNYSNDEILEKVGMIKLLLEEKLLLKVDIIIAKDENREIEKEARNGVLI